MLKSKVFFAYHRTTHSTFSRKKCAQLYNIQPAYLLTSSISKDLQINKSGVISYDGLK